MRYYGLTNFYLSSIQQGIQNAHCVVDMFIKYRVTSCDRVLQLHDWAENHKTMVLLNGGNQQALLDFKMFLSVVPDTGIGNTFAWGSFCEDGQSLNNALTCVGIILPDRIYEAASLLRQRNTNIIKSEDNPDIMWVSNGEVDYFLTLWERELCERLNQCGLAK